MIYFYTSLLNVNSILSGISECYLLYLVLTKLSSAFIQYKEQYSQLPGGFFAFFGQTFFFFFSTELLNQLRRNGERRWLRNLNTATGVTECGHQPAVILVKLMFCRGGVQHFLLRRSLYPVFHSQWSCVSFPSARLCWHNLVTQRCESYETESREMPHAWEKNSECQQKKICITAQ